MAALASFPFPPMFTWIQRTFQHHFKFIFGFVLIGTIVSFIVTIGAAPGIGRADRETITTEFFGHTLPGPGEADPQMITDARLSVGLRLGSGGELGLAGISGDQLNNYALQRTAALHLADTLHLPGATTAELEAFIRTLPVFADKDGAFDARLYASFPATLALVGVSDTAMAQVMSNDVRMDRVLHLLEGPGYVLPKDVADLLVRTDTSWTLGIATVDYASYHPAIAPTNADLAKFFDQNAFRYEYPPRIVASYIDFPASAYQAGVTATDAEVRAYYDANPGRFTAATKGTPAVVTKPADFAAVRPQVEAAYRLEQARRLATKAASDLAYALYDGKVAPGAPLEAFLASRQLALKPLAPFTAQAGPAELGGSPDLGDAASKLSADRYFSDAYPVPNGAAILVWKETQPARKPLLGEVRAKVLADYAETERRRRFVDLGATLRATLASQLKAGATFAQAAATAAAQSGVKIDAKTIPAFEFRSRPASVDETVASTLEHLAKGQVSEMAVAADQGYLVYAMDREGAGPEPGQSPAARGARPARRLFRPGRRRRLLLRNGRTGAQAERASRENELGQKRNSATFRPSNRLPPKSDSKPICPVSSPAPSSALPASPPSRPSEPRTRMRGCRAPRPAPTPNRRASR